MALSYLFLFNKYVLVQFLVEWLDAKDLVKLDTSFSKVNRSQFVNLLIEFREKFDVIYSSALPELKLSLGFIVSSCSRGLPMPNSALICDSFLCELKPCSKSTSMFDFGKPTLELSADVETYLRKLKSLRIYACPHKSTVLLKLLLTKCVAVEEIHVASTLFAENIFMAIAEHCPNLTKLSGVGRLSNVSLSTLKRMLRKCSRLSELSFHNTDGVFVDKNAEKWIKSVLLEPNSLKAFHFGLTYFDAFKLSGSVQSLTALSCAFFDDASLTHFLTHGGGLQLLSLDVARCPRLSIHSTTLIGAHCTLLTELKLQVLATDPTSFPTLIAPLVHLKSFQALHLLSFYSNSPFQYIPNTLAVNCPLIEKLSIHKCNTTMYSAFPLLTDLHMEDVSDVEVVTRVLIEIGPRLTALSLGNELTRSLCRPHVSHACVAIADNCPNLKSLLLHDWYPLPDTVFYLAAKLQHLEEIGLHIDEQSEYVIFFLQNCPKLKTLHLLACVGMFDFKWFDIVSHCGNLREFDLRLKYPNPHKEILMNPEVLRRLVVQSKRLRKLKTSGCHWNVWHIRLFEQELLKKKPDCYISLFEMYSAKSMPS